MNYIVFDLEWNQCPGGKEKENKDLPFEIIEIGAVKLDENRQYVDEFHRLVKPRVYKELTRITRDITKLNTEDLEDGTPFEIAAKELFDWCEADGEYTYATWGSMDLMELQRNCKFFQVNHHFPKPLIYYDIQKLYSLCYSDGDSRTALETAVDELQIEKDIPFHSAISDALYTSKVLTEMDFDKVKVYTSIDTFVIPKSKKEEINVNYGTYNKYISRGFTERDEIMDDGRVNLTNCYICGKVMRKRVRWFSTNQKIYYCLCRCDNHGYVKGKIRIKKTDDNLYYAIKILKQTDEAGAEEIRKRQKDAREKRRERRQREKEKLRK